MKMQQIVVRKSDIKRVIWTHFNPTIQVGDEIRFENESEGWDVMLVFPRISRF
jgi:hypothetical protein